VVDRREFAALGETGRDQAWKAASIYIGNVLTIVQSRSRRGRVADSVVATEVVAGPGIGEHKVLRKWAWIIYNLYLENVYWTFNA
jgi:hypothetical protein